MIEKLTRFSLPAALGVGFFWVLVVNGAIPHWMEPTLGQAIWPMGFALSIANGPFFSVHAHNFGIPHPAGIAFGLSGAWLASLLLRLGLSARDAYAAMNAIWLGLAFFAAFRIARKVGAPPSVAVLGSVVWLTMPIVWAHTPYSMLALGIALLPFYYLLTLELLQTSVGNRRRLSVIVPCHALAAVIAVFMDGYTFMMFAVGSGILLACFLFSSGKRRAVLLIAVPAYVASFALAYFLYSLYVGRGSYGGNPIDFFRGWGVDLTYLLVPTKGMLWVADKLGFAIARTDEFHFGDASVWKTTFCVPIVLLAIIGWARARRHHAAIGVLLVAVFGFYMSLGPSLKIDSLKPESVRLAHPREQSALMPAELAVMPTGNAWISEHLPGFREMRASYRWAALGIFAVWLLAMMGGPYRSRRGRLAWSAALFAVALINAPDGQKPREYISNRQMFGQIDRDLADTMSRYVHQGETIAFLPWGNDFLSGYLAARLRFDTFNIGGDKNLAMAEPGWPEQMQAVGQTLELSDIFPATQLLVTGEADALVLPYFNPLWSAHLWPCVDEATVFLSDATREEFRLTPDFVCPDDQRKNRKPELDAFRAIPYLSVEDTGLFATVRLRPEYAGKTHRVQLWNAIADGIGYPISVNSSLEQSTYLLPGGWHAPEADFVWSSAHATLRVPRPSACRPTQCSAVLHFMVFGASPQRPVTVTLAEHGLAAGWHQQVTATSAAWTEATVPLDGAGNWRELTISVPNATSPAALGASDDDRTLGIALGRIDLRSR
jgi:hypothetical protein